jgi:hypothetical protein
MPVAGIPDHDLPPLGRRRGNDLDPDCRGRGGSNDLGYRGRSGRRRGGDARRQHEGEKGTGDKAAPKIRHSQVPHRQFSDGRNAPLREFYARIKRIVPDSQLSVGSVPVVVMVVSVAVIVSAAIIAAGRRRDHAAAERSGDQEREKRYPEKLHG